MRSEAALFAARVILGGGAALILGILAVRASTGLQHGKVNPLAVSSEAYVKFDCSLSGEACVESTNGSDGNAFLGQNSGTRASVSGYNTGSGPAVGAANAGSGYGLEAVTFSPDTAATIFAQAQGLGPAIVATNSATLPTVEATNSGLGPAIVAKSNGPVAVQITDTDASSLDPLALKVTLTKSKGPNYAIQGDAPGAIGVFAASDDPSTTNPAFLAQNRGGGVIMVAENATARVMSLDGLGNMILKGSLTQHGIPLTVMRNTLGQDVSTFSPHETVSTIEDVGEAQLVNGYAQVPLATDFSALIDQRTSYLVFLTPQGLTHGELCVVGKTSSGFVVRESLGGRSSVLFDYRIIAKPVAASRERLPLYRQPHYQVHIPG